MEFEDILQEVGDSGRFQKSLLLFFGISIALIAPFPGMALVFMVMVPEHSCQLPDVANFSGPQLVASSPENPSCFLRNVSSSSFFVNGSLVVSNDTTLTGCTHGWVYDKTDFDATAATKWNLVCENSHYPSLILTLQNIGSLVGTTIYGALADRFGRKTLVFALLFLAAVTDLLSVLVGSLLLFAVLRTINGSVLPTTYTLPYILISEFMAPEHRVHVNGVFNTCWMAGMCLLPLVAYLSRSWMILGIVNTLASSGILLFWWYVPESASWLISQEKYEDAKQVMMRIGKMNKKLPKEEHLMMQLKELGEKIKRKKEEDQQNFFTFILKYPRLRKHFLILTLCWMANTMAYLGLQYNVINLAGNVFVNFFLLSLVEAPGNLLFWYTMQRMGRRWSATMGFLGIGLCCLLPLTGLPYSDLASSTIGKFIVSGVFMVSDQQGCELYPTVARSLGVGASKSIATIATLFTPFLPYLSIYGKSIPFIAISMACITAAILSSFLPETLNENLPQSYFDAEDLGKDQKYFSFNRKKEKVQQLEISTIEQVKEDLKHDNPTFTMENNS